MELKQQEQNQKQEQQQQQSNNSRQYHWSINFQCNIQATEPTNQPKLMQPANRQSPSCYNNYNNTIKFNS